MEILPFRSLYHSLKPVPLTAPLCFSWLIEQTKTHRLGAITIWHYRVTIMGENIVSKCEGWDFAAPKCDARLKFL